MTTHADAASTAGETSARLEMVTNLILLAANAAASLRGSSASPRDRMYANTVGAALDEALVELGRLTSAIVAADGQ